MAVSIVLAQDTGVSATSASPTAQVAKRVVLPAFTPIVFAMHNTLATDKREKVSGEKRDKTKSRYTNRGETFYMSVAEDILADGVIIIPKGSRGVGEVLSVNGRGGFGKAGKIEITLHFVEVRGKQYPMEGVHLQKGKGQGQLAVAGTVIAGPLAGIFIKGEEADIPAGSRLIFRTKEDIIVEADPS